MKPVDVGIIGSLIFLATRQLLLWILIPLGFLAWLAGCYWLLKRNATLSRWLGWLDLNLMIILLNSILIPFSRGERRKLVPFTDVGSVKHRVSVYTPYKSV